LIIRIRILGLVRFPFLPSSLCPPFSLNNQTTKILYNGEEKVGKINGSGPTKGSEKSREE
jgi:hypothetical protein